MQYTTNVLETGKDSTINCFKFVIVKKALLSLMPIGKWNHRQQLPSQEAKHFGKKN
jgi:hypothetical protein